eukprot:TRINITY_DN47328_c0_g1_i1.p2 TRINITY_DN47328_c0_g1~~TRINITY_DN47328_c0_g1_i1.p2  ORF type:complete len:335 (+),score=51.31 TRINITY_DN47328_c0_g1_i1:74-1006(+)
MLNFVVDKHNHIVTSTKTDTVDVSNSFNYLVNDRRGKREECRKTFWGFLNSVCAVYWTKAGLRLALANLIRGEDLVGEQMGTNDFEALTSSGDVSVTGVVDAAAETAGSALSQLTVEDAIEEGDEGEPSFDQNEPEIDTQFEPNENNEDTLVDAVNAAVDGTENILQGNELFNKWRQVSLEFCLCDILADYWKTGTQKRWNDLQQANLVAQGLSEIVTNRPETLNNNHRDVIFKFLSGGNRSGADVPEVNCVINSYSSLVGWYRLQNRIEQKQRVKLERILGLFSQSKSGNSRLKSSLKQLKDIWNGKIR